MESHQALQARLSSEGGALSPSPPLGAPQMTMTNTQPAYVYKDGAGGS